MLKVLWIGDAGVHTGFATVTHAIGERLVSEYGHDVSVLAANYRGDFWPTNLKMYVPTLLDPNDLYGRTRFVEMLGQVEPDVVVILNDPAVVLRHLFANQFDTEKMLLRYRPILAYMPIDGYDNPPAWDILKECTERVAMSRHGQAAMPGSTLVYHGVDTDVFYPMDRKDAKRALGYDPDRFLVLRVDKNSFRKNYPDTWAALRPLLRKYSDIDVHFHCLPLGGGDGYDLKAYISRDDDIRERVNFSPNLGGFTGWSNEHMRLLYNAADLFISTSWGEGFGLSLAEAAACGIPIVASNASSIPEVVGPGGVCIPPERGMPVPMGQTQQLPNVALFTKEIEHLYLSGGVRRKLGKAGREHVERNFSWSFAARRFHELITDLDTRHPQEEVDEPAVQNLHGDAEDGVGPERQAVHHDRELDHQRLGRG